MSIVECVPNFSEGRDMDKIKQITDAIESVKGVTLLDVDPGAETNRTVVTFVGSPDAVAEGAFVAIRTASEVLDMSTHTGTHPRMGATDVCPFVPVEGITIAECAEIARQVGARVGEELNIPIYLYEAAASSEERRNLANVRRGEYEGLKEKLADPHWKPDFGPAEFNPKAGATAMSAREFLIAYNISLNTRDKQLATDIAFELREKGRVARVGNISPVYIKGDMIRYAEGHYPSGNSDFVGSTLEETAKHCREELGYDLYHLLELNEVPTDERIHGRAVYRAGKFSHCKAIGWFVPEFDRAQISVNLTDYHVTAPHEVLEEARRLAAERGVVVTGSEIVGLVPFQALYESGQYYLRKQGKTAGVPVSDVLATAVQSMGLADVSPFEIESKVLGMPAEGELVSMRVNDICDEVSRNTPAPGGGSIAALSGALGASLASMVATLTHGSRDEETNAELGQMAEKAQSLKDELLHLVDADTDAFTEFMDARRLPQDTDEQKATRIAAMQAGLKKAIEVPWRTAEACFEAMQLADRVARIGLVASMSDGAVGCQAGFTGVRGGCWNVSINLKGIHDKDYVREMQGKCDDLIRRAGELLASTSDFVDAKLRERAGL